MFIGQKLKQSGVRKEWSLDRSYNNLESGKNGHWTEAITI